MANKKLTAREKLTNIQAIKQLPVPRWRHLTLSELRLIQGDEDVVNRDEIKLAVEKYTKYYEAGEWHPEISMACFQEGSDLNDAGNMHRVDGWHRIAAAIAFLERHPEHTGVNLLCQVVPEDAIQYIDNGRSRSTAARLVMSGKLAKGPFAYHMADSLARRVDALVSSSSFTPARMIDDAAVLQVIKNVIEPHMSEVDEAYPKKSKAGPHMRHAEVHTAMMYVIHRFPMQKQRVLKFMKHVVLSNDAEFARVVRNGADGSSIIAYQKLNPACKELYLRIKQPMSEAIHKDLASLTAKIVQVLLALAEGTSGPALKKIVLASLPTEPKELLQPALADAAE